MADVVAAVADVVAAVKVAGVREGIISAQGGCVRYLLEQQV